MYDIICKILIYFLFLQRIKNSKRNNCITIEKMWLFDQGKPLAKKHKSNCSTEETKTCVFA